MTDRSAGPRAAVPTAGLLAGQVGTTPVTTGSADGPEDPGVRRRAGRSGRQPGVLEPRARGHRRAVPPAVVLPAVVRPALLQPAAALSAVVLPAAALPAVVVTGEARAAVAAVPRRTARDRTARDRTARDGADQSAAARRREGRGRAGTALPGRGAPGGLPAVPADRSVVPGVTRGKKARAARTTPPARTGTAAGRAARRTPPRPHAVSPAPRARVVRTMVRVPGPRAGVGPRIVPVVPTAPVAPALADRPRMAAASAAEALRAATAAGMVSGGSVRRRGPAPTVTVPLGTAPAPRTASVAEAPSGPPEPGATDRPTDRAAVRAGLQKTAADGGPPPAGVRPPNGGGTANVRSA